MPETSTGAAAALAPARVLPSGRVEVEWIAGDAFSIDVRDHRMIVDQPVGDGGQDSGPTPSELFVASLASCVAFYAGRYLTRHGVSADGLRVGAEFEMSVDRPVRIAAVRLLVSVPSGLPTERRAALLAVASHCTVHNSMEQPPEVRIGLVPAI